jgi:hypothetical protein
MSKHTNQADGDAERGFGPAQQGRVRSSQNGDKTQHGSQSERRAEVVVLSEADLAETMEHLPADATITIQVSAEAYRQAREMATGGPLVMTTAVAAKVFGWTGRRWRAWAATGRVEGAWPEPTNKGRVRWRLPREACRALVDELAREGRRAAAREMAERSANASPVRPGNRGNNNFTGRSIRRGPRKKKAA